MENINEEVHKAYEIIKNGIILYPTDTVELDVMLQTQRQLLKSC
jgi:hypothetical protein